MAKRSKDTLTGGTGDVSPQFMQGNVAMTAANTFKELVQPIPVQRMVGGAPQKATIIEVLKVFVNIPELDATSAVEAFFNATLQVMLKSQTGITGLGNPSCITLVERSAHKAFTAGGTYETVYTDPIVVDLTDGAGHGILVATDNLFIGAITSGYTNPVNFQWKILYRWKTVSLPEYIGIVQGQQ